MSRSTTAPNTSALRSAQTRRAVLALRHANRRHSSSVSPFRVPNSSHSRCSAGVRFMSASLSARLGGLMASVPFLHRRIPLSLPSPLGCPVLDQTGAKGRQPLSGSVYLPLSVRGPADLPAGGRTPRCMGAAPKRPVAAISQATVWPVEGSEVRANGKVHPEPCQTLAREACKPWADHRTHGCAQRGTTAKDPASGIDFSEGVVYRHNPILCFRRRSRSSKLHSGRRRRLCHKPTHIATPRPFRPLRARAWEASHGHAWQSN